MSDPLAWQNLIFYIPLAAGLLMILGSAFTGHGHDGGADHDAGHDHDQDHDGHHGVGRMLELIGVGKVPLTLALMTALVLFGGLGIIMNVILGALGVSPGLIGPISLVAAAIYAVILSGQTAKLIARFLPTSESYHVTRQDFAGCTGTLLLPADESSGYAQVKDREGNVHNLKCRTVRGATLAKGAPILIIEYDEATRTYVVDANPTA
jgi:membrane protein implicated in regulation of membrane protease activity